VVDLEEFNFISALALVLEMIAFLVILYKIENKKVSKKNMFKGFLLAIVMVFFTYFVQLVFSHMVPFFSSFFYVFNAALMSFILLNRFYRNNFITAFIKTIITFVIIMICQLALFPLIILTSLILPYDSMLMLMNYITQIWIMVFMFYIYPRFKNRVNRMVSDFSNHPRYVLGVSVYMLLYVAIVTYIKAFFIDNNFAFVALILISVTIFVGLAFTIYKYFIKADEEAV